MSEPKRHGAAQALLIAVAALVSHAPALSGGILWDDQTLVFGNPLVTRADGLVRAWSTASAEGYYAPLTTISFWIEHQLWGDDPAPYHATNVLLHACAAILAWRVARQLSMSAGAAVLAGVLYAVHPVTVETVAWISERKNLLSMTLALLAISAYLRFDATGRLRLYALAFLATVAALLAKSAVVPLPLVLLLLIWFRRGAIGRLDALRVVPLLLASLSVGLVTLGLEHPKVHEDLLVRIAIAGCAVPFYLGKLLLPIDLAMIYPRWKLDPWSPLWLVPLASVVAVMTVTWRRRRTWGRGPFAALAIFVVGVSPALGVIPMSYSDRSRVADHLQYGPMLAMLVLAAAWIAPHLLNARPASPGASRLDWIAACGVVPILLALCLRQSGLYQTAEDIWTHTLEINPRSATAWYNRAVVRWPRGDAEGAIEDYDAAIALDDRMAIAFNNRGNLLSAMGSADLAILDFDRAIAIDPGYAGAYNNRAIARRRLDQVKGSIADFTKAIDLAPRYAEAYANRGLTYLDQGDTAAGERDVARALELDPSLASVITSLQAVPR